MIVPTSNHQGKQLLEIIEETLRSKRHTEPVYTSATSHRETKEKKKGHHVRIAITKVLPAMASG